MNIALEGKLAKLPIEEIKGTILKLIKPLDMKLPDKHLGRVWLVPVCRQTTSKRRWPDSQKLKTIS